MWQNITKKMRLNNIGEVRKMCEEKAEFDKSHKIKGALYPYDDKKREECEPQWTKLKGALSDSNITNIAITSSYDTGKTSFLKSFFKKEYSEEEYKFITVPTFSGDNSNIKEEDLEKNIINQLLFSENPRKFPDSRINRIYPYTFWMVWCIWGLLWILGILIFSITSTWNTFWNSGLVRKIIIFLILLFISWWIVFYLVHNFYKISLSGKATLGPMELSGDDTGNDKSDKDLFILYGDEIKYYFKKSNVKFLLLEDMDRFNNIDIFQKLRELNKNINASKWLKAKKDIVFIYTLSDAIFQTQKDNQELNLINENQAAENKAKFFDYIISLMPFSNVNSSEDIFRTELDKYEDLKDHQISNDLLLGISLYISDRREITCIVSDMDTYLRRLSQIQKELESKLKKESNFMDKLFAAVVYKNVYSEDFDNIMKGKSKLWYLLRNLDILKDIVDNANLMVKPSLTKYDNNNNISNLLSVVWDYYEEIVDDSKVNSKLLNTLNYIKDTNILRFLLAKNLIGKDIYEFISPTQFKILSSPDQITFLQHVLTQRRSNTDFIIDNEEDISKIIDLLEASNADFTYVYSSSILERFLQYGNEERVLQIIEGLSETVDNINGEGQKEKIIESKEEFINKIINSLYAEKSEINESGFVSLGWSLYENWKEYFIYVLRSDKYRANAIRFVLDYIAMNGEIKSSYDNNLVSYLIDKEVIDKYEKEIKYSKLSEENKKIVREVIKEEKDAKERFISNTDNDNSY